MLSHFSISNFVSITMRSAVPFSGNHPYAVHIPYVRYCMDMVAEPDLHVMCFHVSIFSYACHEP